MFMGMAMASIELNEALDKAMETTVAGLMDKDCIKNLSPENLAIIQSYIRLVDAVNEYVGASTKLMQSIDEKLDELVKKQNKLLKEQEEIR